MRNDHSIGVIPIYQDEHGELLFCLVQHAAGHWAFPKGHAEPDESEQETARRELQEETGIADVDLRDEQLTETYRFFQGSEDIEKTVTYFIGMVGDMSNATPTEHKTEVTDMAWLSYENARDRLTFEEAKRLIEKARAIVE